MGAHEPNPLREARTGLVTLSVLLGSTALAIVLASVQWSSRNNYRVGFKVTQDATNIVPGTPVLLGGLQWGRVTRVEHAEFRATGSLQDAMQAASAHASRGTLVEFELDPRIELRPGATITRSATVLGGNVALVINDTGGMRGGRSMPGPVSTPIDQGLVLAAADPADASTTLLGLRAAQNLKELPDQFDRLKAFWRDLYGSRVRAAFERIRDSGLALRDAFNTDQPRWSKAIDDTSASMDRLRARFSQDVGSQASLDADISQARARTLAAYDGLKDDIENLKQRFEADAAPKAEALWKRATSEWERTTKLADRLRTAGGDSIDAYRDFMADSSLMGGQISRTLQTPLLAALRAVFGVAVAAVDTDMITRLERYDAASQLVIATDDLRRANDALQHLADQAKPDHPELSRNLREQATRAVTAFRSAVERLVDLSQRP